MIYKVIPTNVFYAKYNINWLYEKQNNFCFNHFKHTQHSNISKLLGKVLCARFAVLWTLVIVFLNFDLVSELNIQLHSCCKHLLKKISKAFDIDNVYMDFLFLCLLLGYCCNLGLTTVMNRNSSGTNDWVCLKCSASNFARRQHCRMCQVKNKFSVIGDYLIEIKEFHYFDKSSPGIV